MAENVMQPTAVPVEEFLATVPPRRAEEARVLVPIIERITGEKAVMWGPSIIGAGEMTYRTTRSTERMPRLAFAPRSAKLTVYFDGFDDFGAELDALGPHTHSVGCLYLTRLDLVQLEVLTSMLQKAYDRTKRPRSAKPSSVEEYIAAIPEPAIPGFTALRSLVRTELPDASEKLSYDIVGYVPAGATRPYLFISGWRDHLGMYPLPKDAALRDELAPWIRGKGTLWIPLDRPVPEALLRRTIAALAAVAAR